MRRSHRQQRGENCFRRSLVHMFPHPPSTQLAHCKRSRLPQRVNTSCITNLSFCDIRPLNRAAVIQY